MTFKFRFLQEHKIHIIDLDVIAREVVDVDSVRRSIIKTWPEVAQTGSTGPNRSAVPTLDRAKLGSIIFSKPEERKRLNGLLKWPITRATLYALLRAYIAGAKCVIVDAPLLFESGLDKLCHVTITVFVDDEEIQIRRLLDRDTKLAESQNRAPITREEAKHRIDSQMSTADRRKRATYEIDNSGTANELDDLTDTLIKHIRKAHKAAVPRNSLITYLTTLFFVGLMFVVYYFTKAT